MRVEKALRYTGRMLRNILFQEPTLVFAKIHTTFRCNLRCTYCNLPSLRTPELSTGQWLSVIDQLADLGCRRVTLTGGESLLRQDLPELIRGIRERGMSCLLVSNGVLVSKMIDRLKLLNTLTLSLDAVGSAHDAVRGEGVFEAVKEAIAAAKGAGIPVKINSVMSVKTAPMLDDLLEFVEQNKIYITIGILRSEETDLWGQAVTIKAEDEEIRRTLKRLANLSWTNKWILFSETTYRYAALWDDFLKDRYETGDLPEDNPILRAGPRCHAGRNYMTILPDGMVYPCIMTALRIPGGNVVTDGVKEAWRQLHQHRCVACYIPCQVEQNFLFSLKPRVVKNFVKKHLAHFH